MSGLIQPRPSLLKKLATRKALFTAVSILFFFIVAFALLPYFLNQSFIKGLLNFTDANRLTFTLIRWCFYGLAMGFGPLIIERKRGYEMTTEDRKSLRWMFLRVFVIYDVIFAFDIFGWRA